MHTILLYYKYTHIEDPEAIKKHQKALCQSLGIKGRILLSEQGINGTVSGPAAQIAEYQKLTETETGIGPIEWKKSEGPEDAFPRLRVVVRPEIVTLGLAKDEDDDSLKHTADYIEPQELLELYEKNEDFVIIDGRNEYEAQLGRFKNAVVPDIDAFRNLPKYVSEKLMHLKDKEVVTYCTGGIRCEKFSGYLRKVGFKNVRQLHGGVHVYAEKTGGKNFDGELFVFDKRIGMTVNTINPEIISHCLYCKEKTARFANCGNKLCNKRMICCETCAEKYDNLCQDCLNK